MFGLNAFGKVGAAIRSAFAALWSPSSLFMNGEQGAWYDPSDLTTMFQDRAGATPVTADGQTVGKILDKSGLGNHAVAPSDAARPLYKTDGTYHWLQFDGVDDSLSTAAINFTSTDKMSMFSGLNSSATTSASIIELSVNINSNDSFCLLRSTNLDFSSHRIAGYQTVSFSQASSSKVVANFDCDTSLSTNEVNARKNGSVPSVTRSNNTNLTGNFGNYPLYLGSRGGSSLYWSGKIYSMIIRGALSTTQEITDTETWVNSKTGAY